MDAKHVSRRQALRFLSAAFATFALHQALSQKVGARTLPLDKHSYEAAFSRRYKDVMLAILKEGRVRLPDLPDNGIFVAHLVSGADKSAKSVEVSPVVIRSGMTLDDLSRQPMVRAIGEMALDRKHFQILLEQRSDDNQDVLRDMSLARNAGDVLPPSGFTGRMRFRRPKKNACSPIYERLYPEYAVIKERSCIEASNNGHLIQISSGYGSYHVCVGNQRYSYVRISTFAPSLKPSYGIERARVVSDLWFCVCTDPPGGMFYSDDSGAICRGGCTGDVPESVERVVLTAFDYAIQLGLLIVLGFAVFAALNKRKTLYADAYPA